MKRIKPNKPFNDTAAFHQAINTIATKRLKLQEIECRRDADIQKIQQTNQTTIDTLKKEINTLAIQCERYATLCRHEILPPERKSSETQLAHYGFRLGQPILKLKHTIAKTVAIFKELNLKQYIKTKETIDKDAIKAAHLSPETLSTFGARIDQNETFYIEPKIESAETLKLQEG